MKVDSCHGLQVEKPSGQDKLLEGATEVITSNGIAEFKLKISSLSSHREKQRFRIQVISASLPFPLSPLLVRV